MIEALIKSTKPGEFRAVERVVVTNCWHPGQNASVQIFTWTCAEEARGSASSNSGNIIFRRILFGCSVFSSNPRSTPSQILFHHRCELVAQSNPTKQQPAGLKNSAHRRNHHWTPCRKKKENTSTTKPNMACSAKNLTRNWTDLPET